jgi:hypothetical protein
MDPPPRSFAADAHGCIMVGSWWFHRMQGCGGMFPHLMASSPLIVTAQHARKGVKASEITGLDILRPMQGRPGNPATPETRVESAEARKKAHTPEAEEKRRATIAGREECLRMLTQIMRDSGYETARMNAAVHLLDRIEGKPRQAVEMSGKDGDPIQTQEVADAFEKLETEELKVLIAIFRKAGLKLPGE